MRDAFKEVFGNVLAEVRCKVDEVVLLDVDVDVHAMTAHELQDEAAEAALRWISVHSTDEHSKQLAAEVVRALSTGGTRWFA